ncbi:MAG: hypothetical protein AAGE89_09270 [Pseudomonadota bacterium]
MFEGDAGALTTNGDESNRLIAANRTPISDILLDGVVSAAGPLSLGGGAAITGFNQSDWVALDATGNPAILTQSSVATVPLPAAAPLLAGGLALLGFIGWRRRRRAL